MYFHFQDLEAAASYYQHKLLDEAARERLLREARARRSTSPSLRSRLAVVLHSVAAWIDDRTRIEVAAPVQALA